MRVRNSVRWLAATIQVRRALLMAIDADVDRFYRSFPLYRPGKKPRRIDRPVGALKFVQRQINDHLLARFPFPSTLHGCVRGRSPKTNAEAHGKTPLLVNLDLSGFYPSVTSEMVHSVWRDVFHFGPPLAPLLTRLTTHRGHLPQGAPTSGFLANIVLLPTTERVEQIATILNCRPSFYVDDISISGRRAREAIAPLIDTVHEHGLAIGRGKTKVMPAHVAQLATGYTINSGRPSVSRRKRDQVRELIHELKVRRRFGDDGLAPRASLEGRIAHIELTNRGDAKRLRKLLARARS